MARISSIVVGCLANLIWIVATTLLLSDSQLPQLARGSSAWSLFSVALVVICLIVSVAIFFLVTIYMEEHFNA